VEASGGPHEVIEVSAEAETVAASLQYEGANVCRTAAISAMLGGDRVAVADVAEPLGELGFDPRLRTGLVAALDVDPFESLTDLWANPDEDGGARRIDLWLRLNDEGNSPVAIAFLVAVLGSPLERESAAAAAALWRQLAEVDRQRVWRYGPWPWYMSKSLERDWPWSYAGWISGEDLGEGDDLDDKPVIWDSERWTEFFRRVSRGRGGRSENLLVVDLLVRVRLSQALRSPDVITCSLARTIFSPPDGPDGATPTSTATGSRVGAVVSTMIHGTWAWKGDWWRPQPGNFHDFIRQNHRHNLYCGGARFSWSGKYRRSDRERAACDFYDWATSEVAPAGVQTVFAHSYGGEIAARAVNAGTPVEEIVFLSVPVTQPVRAAAQSGLRVVDIRLAFDPVLALARKRQRLGNTESAIEVILKQWRLDHSASHQPDTWLSEAVAGRGGI